MLTTEHHVTDDLGNAADGGFAQALLTRWMGETEGLQQLVFDFVLG